MPGLNRDERNQAVGMFRADILQIISIAITVPLSVLINGF
jgi:hypothetical protein